MKIGINYCNGLINTQRNNVSRLNAKKNNVTFSFSGRNNWVTKVNLKDSNTGENVVADLIEKPFNGLYMKNEIMVDGKKVGTAKMSVSPKTANVPFNYRQNGFLYIDSMENTSKGKYRGVGIELLKSAVKRSDDFGFDGRVALIAARNAHTFHYKFGFEPCSDIKDNKSVRKILEAESRKKEPHCEFLGYVDMYLPQKRIDEILCG